MTVSPLLSTVFGRTQALGRHLKGQPLAFAQLSFAGCGVATPKNLGLLQP